MYKERIENLEDECRKSRMKVSELEAENKVCKGTHIRAAKNPSSPKGVVPVGKRIRGEEASDRQIRVISLIAKDISCLSLKTATVAMVIRKYFRQGHQGDDKQ